MALSQFHIDLSAAVSARLSNQGHLLDSSQLSALVADIEQVVVNDQATCVAQATADLGLIPDPPQGGF
jgi:hypothetical protein